MQKVLLLAGVFLVAATGIVRSAVIGTNLPALPLVSARIQSLPEKDRSAWREYLERSRKQKLLDQQFLRSELKQAGIQNAIPAPSGTSATRLKWSQPADWYASDEALRIADIVVSYQTPAGGWGKNLNLTQKPRPLGGHFVSATTSKNLAAPNDDVVDADWSYVGTFDNNATTTEMRFLARLLSARKPGEAQRYKEAFERGLNYLLNAQMPNGGWPQTWPLSGGYHDSITLNDGAMPHVLAFLLEVEQGSAPFEQVDRSIRNRAGQAVALGLHCLLELQIQHNGIRLAWAQQYDPLTLQPVAARNYEMPAVASGESCTVLEFLQRVPRPTPGVIVAVQSAVRWLERSRLEDVVFADDGDRGRMLMTSKGAPPLWARYYAISTGKPIFGDRDRTIHDTVNGISRERRNGYAWFSSGPQKTLDAAQAWLRLNPENRGKSDSQP